MYAQADYFESNTWSVRRPIQCEGIARGTDRMAEIGVAGSVNPQFWGALASLAPIAIDLIRKALR